MMWSNLVKPLKTYNLPSEESQNVFGAVRKYDIHTGVDLFCDEGEPVFSMYHGWVTNVIKFTGFAESPWWNNTHAVLIYHPEIDKTFLYGELAHTVYTGQRVNAGQCIGNVKTVLKHDKGLPMTMLHMECYSGKWHDAVWWHHDEEKPEGLEDIMPYLK